MKTMCPLGYHHNGFVLCWNSCTWAYVVQLHITGTIERKIYILAYLAQQSLCSMVPAMCTHTSCTNEHVLPQRHYSDNQ